MNEKDIPQCCTPMPVEEDTKMLCLLILFLAMDDEAREIFFEEAQIDERPDP